MVEVMPNETGEVNENSMQCYICYIYILDAILNYFYWRTTSREWNIILSSDFVLFNCQRRLQKYSIGLKKGQGERRDNLFGDNYDIYYWQIQERSNEKDRHSSEESGMGGILEYGHLHCSRNPIQILYLQ